MTRAVMRSLLFLLIAVAMAGCTVVGGIFKAGMVVGIFIVVIVVVLLFLLFGRR